MKLINISMYETNGLVPLSKEENKKSRIKSHKLPLQCADLFSFNFRKRARIFAFARSEEDAI